LFNVYLLFIFWILLINIEKYILKSYLSVFNVCVVDDDLS